MRRQLMVMYLLISVSMNTVASITIADSCSKLDLKSFAYTDCKKFIGKGNFRSREELLQIFFNAYFDKSISNIRMNKTEITHLSDLIRTLFQ